MEIFLFNIKHFCEFILTITPILFSECITNVVAYDPDIPDRNEDQKIVYSILRPEHQPLIGIDKYGCMKLKKPLDRDPPHGYPVWTVRKTLVEII